MATIRKEFVVGVGPEQAWDALSDYANLHERLVPGFVTAAYMDGNDRVVTFFTGNVLRERLVTLDHSARRLVWSVVDGPYDHHNGSVDVLDDEAGARLVWTADLLPEEAAESTEAMMQKAVEVMKQTLEPAQPARR